MLFLLLSWEKGAMWEGKALVNCYYTSANFCLHLWHIFFRLTPQESSTQNRAFKMLTSAGIFWEEQGVCHFRHTPWKVLCQFCVSGKQAFLILFLLCLLSRVKSSLCLSCLMHLHCSDDRTQGLVLSQRPVDYQFAVSLTHAFRQWSAAKGPGLRTKLGYREVY